MRIGKNILHARAKRFFSNMNASKAKADFALFYNTDSTSSTDANFSYFSGTEINGSVLLISKYVTGVLLTSVLNYEKARILSPYPVVKFARAKAYEEIRKLAGRGKLVCGLDLQAVSAARYFSE